MAPRENKEINGRQMKEERVSPLWTSPTYRNQSLIGVSAWLNGKRKDDGAKDLWRIHDHLYDLSTYMKHHPGGQEWLKITKGTDITEAFEAHHVSDRPRKMLSRFLVKQANGPRHSIFTFAKDGFYQTLRHRVREEFRVTETAKHLGPPFRTRITADLLCIAVLITGCLATTMKSTIFTLISGMLLTLLTISGHNFFHQRDSFRMYYFDLCLLSSHDWRISHALSHHLFPNSMLDLEVSMFEPLLQWLPSPKKGFIVRYISWIYSPILWTFIFHFDKLKRILTCKLDWRDAIPLILPLTFWGVTGFALDSIATVLWTWSYILFTSSFLFGYIGLNAGHHHPEVYHAGDETRKDHDWGLYQIDAVKDRIEVCSGAPELALVTFGNHALHHLFPTIDNAHLPKIYPIFYKTCKEFGINFKFANFWITTKGQFQQLARNKPNPNPPIS